MVDVDVDVRLGGPVEHADGAAGLAALAQAAEHFGEV